MGRTRGTGRIWKPTWTVGGERKTTSVWWLQYYDSSGRQIRESAKTSDLRAAERLLRKRLTAVEAGRAVGGTVARATWDDLARLIREDYTLNKRRSAKVLELRLRHLGDVFGRELVRHITTAKLRSYQAQRVAEGASPASVNREISVARRAFRLGARSGLVEQLPVFQFLQEAAPRRGFLEADQFLAIVGRLPEELRPPVQVAYLTGWRFEAEILTRRWQDVDWDGGFLLLAPGEAKDPMGRSSGRAWPLDTTLPEIGSLRAILEAQRARAEEIGRARRRIIPWVFFRGDGQPIVSMRGWWEKACRDAGHPGRLLHDFRRTAVRRLERSGVPRSTAMALVGHKTEAIYRRYAIVDESSLRRAAELITEAAAPPKKETAG